MLVSFRIGDIWADAFTYDKGEKKGQAGASLKGRLLFIGWIKVDGKLVYEAKPKNATPPADNQGQPGVDQSLNQEQPAPDQPVNQEQPVADQFGEQPEPDFGNDLPKEANQAA